jgi:RNA ligase
VDITPRFAPVPPTLEELERVVAAGYVRARPHPVYPLTLYTYTEACVYGGHWDATTRLCRGLIVETVYDGDLPDFTAPTRVIAWPFPKFFNHSEHENGKPYAPPLPDRPFEVYAKLDGSLGIVFHYAGRWHVATKGSFTSEQAQWAQAWLNSRQPDVHLTPGITYLTEIVYPQNRIVVDYHGAQGLILLGAYDPYGYEISLSDPNPSGGWKAMGGGVVLPLDVPNLDRLVTLAANNQDEHGHPVSGAEQEGWVVRFSDGTRVKVKTADYVRLHGTLTRTNSRTIWEALSQGTDPVDILGTVPDEFLAWVQDVSHRLATEKDIWEMEVHYAFTLFASLRHDRKAFALAVKDSPYKSALFRLLDGKDIEEMAWKFVRPEVATTPYDPEETETGGF